MLLVFATASAPKAFFHDLVADHEDVEGCFLDHHEVVLHQVEPRCDMDDLVVPVPYYLSQPLNTEPPAGCTEVFFGSYIPSHTVSQYQHHHTRGPPHA